MRLFSWLLARRIPIHRRSSERAPALKWKRIILSYQKSRDDEPKENLHRMICLLARSAGQNERSPSDLFSRSTSPFEGLISAYLLNFPGKALHLPISAECIRRAYQSNFLLQPLGVRFHDTKKARKVTLFFREPEISVSPCTPGEGQTTEEGPKCPTSGQTSGTRPV